MVVLIVGMLAIANVESAAAAAEFAGLGVFFMLLISLPVVLLVNAMALRRTGTGLQHFGRGMILPGLVLLLAILYQTGVWDALT